jgi:uncharacterized protein (TIGR02246 family)
MRRMSLPLMLLVVACRPAAMELTDAQKDAIAAEVDAIHAENVQAWVDADFDRAMSHFQHSPDMLFAFEGGLMRGWDSMYNAWAPMFEGVARQEMTIVETHTVVLARNAVSIMAQGTFAFVDDSGNVGPVSPFALTLVYLLRDGEWKVVLGHESVPTPEAESM